MKHPNLMKKTIIVWLILCGFTARVSAQATVIDATAVSQRLTLFLEEMEEAVEQRLTLLEQAESMRQHLALVQDAKKKLREVSHYVQTSAYTVDIVNYGTSIVKKVRSFRTEIAGLDGFTDEEKYNITLNMLQLADYGAGKVEEGVTLSKSNSSDGEFSDYERLQLLKDIRQELGDLDAQLDEVLSVTLSTNAYNELTSGLKDLAMKAIMFDFQN